MKKVWVHGLVAAVVRFLNSFIFHSIFRSMILTQDLWVSRVGTVGNGKLQHIRGWAMPRDVEIGFNFSFFCTRKAKKNLKSPTFSFLGNHYKPDFTLTVAAENCCLSV